jgi:2-polyprenyl-6-hydroxyphenyl methylase/3-demethylubiquinone-9 3-methyltransferase
MTSARASRSAGNDLELYERNAGSWWDARSPAFRSLHAVNDHRLRVLHNWLGERFEGRVVADFGCGGGLLALPLSQSGARVVGIDLSAASLAQAREHVAGAFVRADAQRAPLADASVDVVLLADVLEHVPDSAAVLREAARVLRPGGAAFVNTLNRTWRARLLAVQLAEGVRLIPPGTHAAELFIRPDELAQRAWSCGLSLEALQGESVNLLRTVRTWAISLRPSADVSVGYSALLRKVVES